MLFEGLDQVILQNPTILASSLDLQLTPIGLLLEFLDGLVFVLLRLVFRSNATRRDASLVQRVGTLRRVGMLGIDRLGV
jgi:hypothetical protein